jgi:hypothetical protein
VKEFLFLGRFFEKGGGGKEALNKRIQKAWGAFWANKAVLLDPTLSLKKRLAFMSQTAGAVILYAAESLELSRAQLLLIRTTRRQMTRRMSGRKWRGSPQEEEEEEEEETEEQERAEADEESIEYGRWVSHLTKELEDLVEAGGAGTKWEEEALRRKFAWTGHILRRGQARRTARVAEAEQVGTLRVRRGAPTTRWADSFRSVLGDDWQASAQDRHWWRFWATTAQEGLIA